MIKAEAQHIGSLSPFLYNDYLWACHRNVFLDKSDAFWITVMPLKLYNSEHIVNFCMIFFCGLAVTAQTL